MEPTTEFDFDAWLKHRKRMAPLSKFLHKLPDWLIIALYTITQPIMHSRKIPGPCRLETLCEEHSFRISK